MAAERGAVSSPATDNQSDAERVAEHRVRGRVDEVALADPRLALDHDRRPRGPSTRASTAVATAASSAVASDERAEPRPVAVAGRPTDDADDLDRLGSWPFTVTRRELPQPRRAGGRRRRTRLGHEDLAGPGERHQARRRRWWRRR